jgi:hypothetical protein
MRKHFMAATAICFCALALIGRDPDASSSGIINFSGNPATGGVTCNNCHSGGIVPSVVILGPTVVAPSSTHTYTLRISGGQQVAGGLDVSVTAGSLGVSDPGTLLAGGEITHQSPRPVDGNLQVLFTFNWTAPAVPGTATLYGAGNSVNLNGTRTGDRAQATTLLVTIENPASTPGEASGPTVAPLLVTAFDPFTGDLSLSYGPACGTSSNNIYFGPLDDVASLAWSGEECSIGNSGSFTGFDPGADSYFFVVVGTRDADEGSYGRSLLPDGSVVERPPMMGSACGQQQTLAATCD